MSRDPRKRQKQLAKRTAKRKSKQQLLVREKNAGLAERLGAAANYPIVDSWVTETLWTEGIGQIALSRQLPNGSVAFAIFLVDRYCLGVKNAMSDITSRFDYDSRIVHDTRRQFSSRPISPSAARNLVERAVAYAENLGLAPHPDYHRAKLLFGDIDREDNSEALEFGKDGKPFFVAGPSDGPARCRHILKTLEEHCGRDGFHYLIPMAGSTEILPESVTQSPNWMIDDDETDDI